MLIHKDPRFTIYFGDKQSSMHRDFWMRPCSNEELWNQRNVSDIAQQLNLEELVLLKQTHSVLGASVSDETLPVLLKDKPEGDYLVTQRLATGLGIYTADCLPIVIYDSAHHAIGMCHAGWVGTVHRVVVHMLEHMQREFGTSLDTVQVFFGPAAKPCCYEVKDDFLSHIEKFSFKDQLMTRRDGNMFFDTTLCNQLQLMECGVKAEAFDFASNECTMCEGSYCSHRRYPDSKDRQLAVVALSELPKKIVGKVLLYF